MNSLHRMMTLVLLLVAVVLRPASTHAASVADPLAYPAPVTVVNQSTLPLPWVRFLTSLAPIWAYEVTQDWLRPSTPLVHLTLLNSSDASLNGHNYLGAVPTVTIAANGLTLSQLLLVTSRYLADAVADYDFKQPMYSTYAGVPTTFLREVGEPVAGRSCLWHGLLMADYVHPDWFLVEGIGPWDRCNVLSGPQQSAIV